MENSVYQKYISCKMFDFLCNVVGSAKTVKNRRLFFKIMDDVLCNRVCTYIISGSKAEGLDMKSSDTDFMTILKVPSVYQCQSQIDSICGLIIDKENAAPGFVLLKHPHRCIPYPLFPYTYSEYGLLLSSGEFRKWLLERHNGGINMLPSTFKIHGPCLSTIDDMVDFAICLKSEMWPFVCMKWFYRPRYSKWPTSNDVEKIAKEGLLYVPIGSKFGSKNDNSLEWRISFSVPEKILVHSFNQVQFICYALLKIVLKEVINTNSQIINLLCSYFLKTVVFWLAEESDPSSWNPETLFTCFQFCLDRLIYWVRIGYCPNYFIPENNMFEGKIVGECQRNLLDFLTVLRNEGLKFINRSDTLTKFISDDNLRYNINDSEAEDKAMYSLLNNYFIFRGQINNYRIMRRLSWNLVNGGQLTKSLYLLWLMNYYVNMVGHTRYEFHASNKFLYRCYKLLLSYCLIGKKYDVVSGGALLATFFYRHKEYEKSLSVMNYALQECTPDKYFVQTNISFNFEGNDINNTSITFLQRHKLSCIYDYIILLSQESVLNIEEPGTKYIVSFGLISAPPNVFIHYLRFMCFHHMGNFVERNRCLEDIKLTLEEGFLTRSSGFRSVEPYYIHALMVANRCDGWFSETVEQLALTITELFTPVSI